MGNVGGVGDMADMAEHACSIARECGACSSWGVPYAKQLARKQAQVEGLFPAVAAAGRLRPILGMEHPFAYRDKIASPFAPARARGKGAGPAGKGGKGAKGGRANGKGAPDVLCGMYAAGTHRIVACGTCPVEHPVGRRVVRAVRALMLKWNVPAYDEDAGTGLVRHVVVRVGHESGEVLVTVVTNGEWPQGRPFARQLVQRVPEITTVVQNVNTRATNAILGHEGEHVLYGPGFILDTLCGLSFRISAHSFYQVNARQTEVLYDTALGLLDEFLQAAPAGDAAGDAAGTAGDAAAGPAFELVDAYCGTGTIGLVAASRLAGAHVVGVDNVEAAIRDARQNAAHNGVGNARFECADAGAFMRARAAAGNPADVLLMDPPRAGATPDFLQAALQMAPRAIVYISCNPQTQARDCATLAQGGYHVAALQPVDMFPHTRHVETVALLAKAAG